MEIIMTAVVILALMYCFYRGLRIARSQIILQHYIDAGVLEYGPRGITQVSDVDEETALKIERAISMYIPAVRNCPGIFRLYPRNRF